MSSTLRLAFTHISRRAWAGGYNYLNNLFSALDTHQRGRFSPVVFASESADERELAELAQLPSVEVVRSKVFDNRRQGLLAAVAWGLDGRAVDMFKEKHIDVVIETARFFGWRMPYPAVAWFPDLQHRRLPHLFSVSARIKREFGFRLQIASQRTIMLSSEDARQDCDEFYPALKGKSCVVRFATHPPAEFLSLDASEVVKRYELPERYFYLPNQFWKHKNHQVVIDALEILQHRGISVVVVASGNSETRQQKEYCSDLMAQVQQRGLQENFRYLGMIPLGHVYALLRRSTALINPSAFEGWSTTVEEAKSFGVPMLLSDIRVHREQASDNVNFFNLDDPAALADYLAHASMTRTPVISRLPRQDVEERVAAFAADFAKTIDIARSRFFSRL